MGKKHKDRDGDKKAKHGHDSRVHNETPFELPPQVAGIAAAALSQMGKQVNTPAFQQLIATSLGAAGQAMSAMAQRSAAERAGAGVAPHAAAAPPPPAAPVPPAQPTPPLPPEPPVPPEPQAAYRPHFETPPIQLSPEAAQAIERVAAQAAQAIEGAAASATRAIETAAAAFERWAEKAVKPKPPGE